MPPDDPEGKALAFTRRAESTGDQPLLLALFIAARAHQFAPLNLPAATLEMLMRQQFQAQDAGFLARYPAARREVVDVDGVSVGRLVSDQTGDRLHLVDIALTPPYRNRGLGGALISQLQDEARAAGLAMSLRVAIDNVRATALYARLGFETTASDDMNLEMRWTAPG